MDPIERNNWLAHRWPIKKRTHQYGGWTIHIGEIDGGRIFQATSVEEYDARIQREKPICLARFIAGERKLHPVVALAVAEHYRLGRIPP